MSQVLAGVVHFVKNSGGGGGASLTQGEKKTKQSKAQGSLPPTTQLRGRTLKVTKLDLGSSQHGMETAFTLPPFNRSRSALPEPIHG